VRLPAERRRNVDSEVLGGRILVRNREIDRLFEPRRIEARLFQRPRLPLVPLRKVRLDALRRQRRRQRDDGERCDNERRRSA
jgi:hypothetical protein